MQHRFQQPQFALCFTASSSNLSHFVLKLCCHLSFPTLKWWAKTEGPAFILCILMKWINERIWVGLVVDANIDDEYNMVVYYIVWALPHVNCACHISYAWLSISLLKWGGLSTLTSLLRSLRSVVLFWFLVSHLLEKRNPPSKLG